MTAPGACLSYGPVPSRRLGKSLGINNIPAKVCTYSCVYCQAGRTTRLEHERRPFYDPEDIARDVQRRLANAKQSSERVDYLTFVPDGEPTLDANLGKEIALVSGSAVQVGAITNGSLLWREDVREELGKADWVSVKVDAVRETAWRQINRPHCAARLSAILDGILAFAERFAGTLVTETMLVSGLNDDDACVRAVADFLDRVQPDRAYLGIPTRPPAEKMVRAPDAATVNRAYQIFAERINVVECLIGYEGDDFASTGDIEKDILGITAVHPMREDAVRMLLSRAGSSWEVVDRLCARGDLARTKYEGHVFLVRSFAGGSSAAT